jgi:hypothetical protein
MRVNSPLRVGFVTCAQLPDLDDDTQQILPSLRALGVKVLPLVWDDAGVDWTSVDLAVVRSCWDYVGRRSEFLAWAAAVPRLANPAAVLAWNTDKRYLLDLSEAGVPIVPTIFVNPDDAWTPSKEGDWVIKPAESIASLDSGKYRLRDATEHRLAVAHVGRLQAQGRTVMVQPYLRGIDREGETSLVFFARRLSHAMRKAAVLHGPDAGVDRRFLPDGGLQLRPHQPSSAQLAVADLALANVPGGADNLLYARVDLVPGDDGRPVLMELELTEPQLYFRHVPEAARRFASILTVEGCAARAVRRRANAERPFPASAARARDGSGRKLEGREIQSSKTRGRIQSGSNEASRRTRAGTWRRNGSAS